MTPYGIAASSAARAANLYGQDDTQPQRATDRLRQRLDQRRAEMRGRMIAPQAPDLGKPVVLDSPPQVNLTQPMQATAPSGGSILSTAARATQPVLGVAGGLANILDIPGSMVRDVLTLNNPFDQLLTPASPENRVTGEEMLEQYGVYDDDPNAQRGFLKSAGRFVGGLGVEIALDPLTWLTGGLGAGLKAFDQGGDAMRQLSKMGLVDDSMFALNKRLTDAAFKKTGKKMGKREAAMNVSAADVIEAGSEYGTKLRDPQFNEAIMAGEAKKVSDTFADGLNLANAADRLKEVRNSVLQENYFTWQLPFLPKTQIRFFKGDSAKKYARFVDTVGEKIRFGNLSPVMKTAPIWSKAVKGAKTPAEQKRMLSVADDYLEAQAAARGLLFEANRAIADSGVLSYQLPKNATDEQIKAVNDRVSGFSDAMYRYLEDVNLDRFNETVKESKSGSITVSRSYNDGSSQFNTYKNADELKENNPRAYEAYLDLQELPTKNQISRSYANDSARAAWTDDLIKNDPYIRDLSQMNLLRPLDEIKRELNKGLMVARRTGVDLAQYEDDFISYASRDALVKDTMDVGSRARGARANDPRTQYANSRRSHRRNIPGGTSALQRMSRETERLGGFAGIKESFTANEWKQRSEGLFRDFQKKYEYDLVGLEEADRRALFNDVADRNLKQASRGDGFYAVNPAEAALKNIESLYLASANARGLKEFISNRSTANVNEGLARLMERAKVVFGDQQQGSQTVMGMTENILGDFFIDRLGVLRKVDIVDQRKLDGMATTDPRNAPDPRPVGPDPSSGRYGDDIPSSKSGGKPSPRNDGDPDGDFQPDFLEPVDDLGAARNAVDGFTWKQDVTSLKENDLNRIVSDLENLQRSADAGNINDAELIETLRIRMEVNNPKVHRKLKEIIAGFKGKDPSQPSITTSAGGVSKADLALVEDLISNAQTVTPNAVVDAVPVLMRMRASTPEDKILVEKLFERLKYFGREDVVGAANERRMNDLKKGRPVGTTAAEQSKSRASRAKKKGSGSGRSKGQQSKSRSKKSSATKTASAKTASELEQDFNGRGIPTVDLEEGVSPESLGVLEPQAQGLGLSPSGGKGGTASKRKTNKAPKGADPDLPYADTNIPHISALHNVIVPNGKGGWRVRVPGEGKQVRKSPALKKLAEQVGIDSQVINASHWSGYDLAKFIKDKITGNHGDWLSKARALAREQIDKNEFTEKIRQVNDVLRMSTVAADRELSDELMAAAQKLRESTVKANKSSRRQSSKVAATLGNAQTYAKSLFELEDYYGGLNDIPQFELEDLRQAGLWTEALVLGGRQVQDDLDLLFDRFALQIGDVPERMQNQSGGISLSGSQKSASPEELWNTFSERQKRLYVLRDFVEQNKLEQLRTKRVKAASRSAKRKAAKEWKNYIGNVQRNWEVSQAQRAFQRRPRPENMQHRVMFHDHGGIDYSANANMAPLPSLQKLVAPFRERAWRQHNEEIFGPDHKGYELIRPKDGSKKEGFTYLLDLLIDKVVKYDAGDITVIGTKNKNYVESKGFRDELKKLMRKFGSLYNGKGYGSLQPHENDFIKVALGRFGFRLRAPGASANTRSLAYNVFKDSLPPKWLDEAFRRLREGLFEQVPEDIADFIYQNFDALERRFGKQITNNIPSPTRLDDGGTVTGSEIRKLLRKTPEDMNRSLYGDFERRTAFESKDFIEFAELDDVNAQMLGEAQAWRVERGTGGPDIEQLNEYTGAVSNNMISPSTGREISFSEIQVARFEPGYSDEFLEEIDNLDEMVDEFGFSEDTAIDSFGMPLVTSKEARDRATNIIEQSNARTEAAKEGRTIGRGGLAGRVGKPLFEPESLSGSGKNGMMTYDEAENFITANEDLIRSANADPDRIRGMGITDKNEALAALKQPVGGSAKRSGPDPGRTNQAVFGDDRPLGRSLFSYSMTANQIGVGRRSLIARHLDVGAAGYDPIEDTVSQDVAVLIKENKRPFESLEEFLTSDLPALAPIQEALERNNYMPTILRAARRQDEAIRDLNITAFSPFEHDGIVDQLEVLGVKAPEGIALNSEEGYDYLNKLSRWFASKGQDGSSDIISSLANPLNDTAGTTLGSKYAADYMYPEAVIETLENLTGRNLSEEAGYPNLQTLLAEEPQVFSQAVQDLQNRLSNQVSGTVDYGSKADARGVFYQMSDAEAFKTEGYINVLMNTRSGQNLDRMGLADDDIIQPEDINEILAGVYPEEEQFMGLRGFLEDVTSDGDFTVRDLKDYIEDARPRVQVINLGQTGRQQFIGDSVNAGIPGTQTELVVRLPNGPEDSRYYKHVAVKDLYGDYHAPHFTGLNTLDEVAPRIWGENPDRWVGDGGRELMEPKKGPMRLTAQKPASDNVLMHITLSDYVNESGQKILLVQNVESDMFKIAQEAAASRRALEKVGFSKSDIEEIVDRGVNGRPVFDIDTARMMIDRYPGVERTSSGKYTVPSPDGSSFTMMTESQIINKMRDLVNAPVVLEKRLREIGSEGLPDTPFGPAGSSRDDVWRMFGMKTAARIAADGNYDGIAVLNGADVALASGRNADQLTEVNQRLAQQFAEHMKEDPYFGGMGASPDLSPVKSKAYPQSVKPETMKLQLYQDEYNEFTGYPERAYVAGVVRTGGENRPIYIVARDSHDTGSFRDHVENDIELNSSYDPGPGEFKVDTPFAKIEREKEKAERGEYARKFFDLDGKGSGIVEDYEHRYVDVYLGNKKVGSFDSIFEAKSRAALILNNSAQHTRKGPLGERFSYDTTEFLFDDATRDNALQGTFYQAHETNGANASIQFPVRDPEDPTKIGDIDDPQDWMSSSYKTLVVAYQNADPYSFVHEMGHLMRMSLRDLDPAMLARVEQQLGVKNNKWAVQIPHPDRAGEKVYAEEYFADAFMQWVKDGGKPSDSGPEGVWQTFKNFISTVHNRFAKGSEAEVKLRPEMHQFFDDLMGEQAYTNSRGGNVMQVLDGLKYTSPRALNAVMEGLKSEDILEAEKAVLYTRLGQKRDEIVSELRRAGDPDGEAKVPTIDALADELSAEIQRIREAGETMPSSIKVGSGSRMMEIPTKVTARQKLEQFQLPSEVIDDVTRVYGLTSELADDSLFKGYGDWYDAYTNTFKSNVTAVWPNFHFRNLLSGAFQNALNDVFDPTQKGFIKRYTQPYLDAATLMVGDTVQGLEVIKWLDADSAEEATEALKKLAFRYGVFDSPGQHRELYGIGGAAAAIPGMKKYEGNNLRQKMFNFIKQNGKSVNERLPSDMRPQTLLGKAGQAVNMLDVAGGLSSVDKFAPARYGRQIGDLVEGSHRLGGFIALLKQGYDPAEAAKRIRLLQVDYSDLTSAERNVIRRIFPFYSFSKGMSKYLANEIYTKPGGKVSQSIRTAERSGDRDVSTPEYIQQGVSIPVGEADDGTKRFVTGLGLMHESVLPLFDSVASTVAGRTSVQKPLFEIAGMMNPVPKGLIETGTNRSLFQEDPRGGRLLSEMDPPVGRTLSNVGRGLGLTSSEDPVATPQLMESLVSNSPLSKLASSARQLTDTRKGVLTKGVNFMTGIRMTDVSPQAQDQILRERLSLLSNQMGGRTFERDYIPQEVLESMPPELRGQAEVIQSAQAKLAERAKHRKAIREMQLAQENN